MIPWEEQRAWFLNHMDLLPARMRGLCLDRFEVGNAEYGDGIFRKLLTPEGEAALLRDMDEEEADWWVYWLVSRMGFELAERHYPADVKPSDAVYTMRRTKRPEGW